MIFQLVWPLTNFQFPPLQIYDVLMVKDIVCLLLEVILGWSKLSFPLIG